MLKRFFQAERIKWRKSWTLVTAVLAPVCQSSFLLIILWHSESLVRRFKPGFEFWIELNYLAWNMVFMPIVAAVVSDVSWDVEQEGRVWNLLLIQPVPRRTHYQVKLLSHLSLLFLSQVLLALLLIVEGWLLGIHLSRWMGPFPTHTLLQFGGFTLLASIPLVAFHTWFSARFPGLAIALVPALGGAWICAKWAGTTPLIQVLPWGMSSQVITFFDRWKRHIPWEYFIGALLCAALLMVLGTLDFSRDREPKR